MNRCGKVRYNSRSEAERSMGRLRDKFRVSRSHVPVRVYECPRCHGWHVTSKAAPGVPVGVRPTRRLSRSQNAGRRSADGRWTFLRVNGRWMSYLAGEFAAQWPEGHLALVDAIDDAERVVVEAHRREGR